MKISSLIKVICVGLSLIALTACSSTKHGVGAGGYGANGSSVQAAGLGDEAQFPGARAGEVEQATGERKNTVYFDYDQSSIAAKYMHIIHANAQYLRNHPNARVRLEGHTDPRGSREYNIGLGQRRGNQVENHLHEMGIPLSQITVVSYGKEKLAVPGDTSEDYRLDRRVEIIYEAN